MSDERIPCPDCDKEVSPNAWPTHQVGHKIEKETNRILKGFQDALTQVRDSIKIPELPDINTALRESLSPITNALNGLLSTDTYPSPEAVQAHIAECPDCAAKWQGVFSNPEPEPAPAPAPEPQPEPPPTPKRLTLPDSTYSHLDMDAFRVNRHEHDTGIQLSVASEEEGKEAVEAGVVPKCRWVKAEDGSEYWACEE